MEPLLLVRSNGGAVAEIVLNRPRQHNALNLAMWQALRQMADGIAADRSIRAVVIRGAGQRAFSAGADVGEFEQTRTNREVGVAYNRTLREAMEAVVRLPMPVLARIHGYCIGGGCELALCADLRVCDPSAEFGIPAARLGTGLDLGDVQRLVRLVGPAYAQEILFTAGRVSAERALSIGLVNAVVAADEMDGWVAGLLSEILAGSPLALRQAKQDVRLVLDDPALLSVPDRDQHAAALFDSQDYREGVRAFLEKRPPKFPGF